MVILGNQTMSVPNVEVADLAITKSHSGNFWVGSNGFYTLNITNNGPSSTSGTVTVTDTLPTGLTYVSGTGTGWSCSATGQVVTCTRSTAMTKGESSAITLTVSVAAAAAPSVTNTATVTSGVFDNVSANNTASDATAVTASGSGNKPLYLYDGGSSPARKLSRTPMTVDAGSYVTIARGSNTVTWTLSPVLASAVKISSGNIPVELMLATNSSSSRTYTIPITLKCGTNTVASETTQTAVLSSTVTHFSFTLPLASDYTCPAGSALSLDITNTMTGLWGARDVRVYPAPSTGNYSYVNLMSQNVIKVDSVSFYDAAYPSGTQITSAAPGQKIYVRATVSDPFGAYDITGATIAMMNPSDAVVSPTPAAMMQTSYTDAASKIYEYPFTLPTGAGALGDWTARIIADEGTEGTVGDKGTSSITVSLAEVSILKSADKTTAVSGDVITYSILITNTGNGPATSVSIDDTLSPYIQWGLSSYSGAAFNISQGTTPSGLTLGTPVYSKDNGTTWTYTPVSEGGGAPVGYDGNVTGFRLPLTGTMNPSGASCTINYKVRTKD